MAIGYILLAGIRCLYKIIRQYRIYIGWYNYIYVSMNISILALGLVYSLISTSESSFSLTLFFLFVLSYFLFYFLFYSIKSNHIFYSTEETRHDLTGIILQKESI
ncbi:hypothetical protein BDF14DRAFT_1768768 [Spinellus fusiger]|nr:hypothetical protein BDF14DRAFT_1768768 [Spinellus fusiger]